MKSYTRQLLTRWRRELVKVQSDDCQINSLLKDSTLISDGPAVSVSRFSSDGWKSTNPLNINTLDLGDMECRIIPLKGHTRGSVGIWIPKLRLLLSGDALTPVMCLLFQNHLSAEEQYRTLKYVHKLEFDYYLTSHHSKIFSRKMIGRLIRCMENSKCGKWHIYQYPAPPYANGRIYLDSMEDEPVAVICESVF